MRYDRGWIVGRNALVTAVEFAPLFETLLVAGYSWVNLSAYWMFKNDLVVGIELPREPVGLAVYRRITAGHQNPASTPMLGKVSALRSVVTKPPCIGSQLT